MRFYILISHHHDKPSNVAPGAPGSWNCFTFKATKLKAFYLSPPILIQAEEDQQPWPQLGDNEAAATNA